MTKEELIQKLNDIVKNCDNLDLSLDHEDADDLLLKYIDDKDIEEAFKAIDKWYG